MPNLPQYRIHPESQERLQVLPENTEQFFIHIHFLLQYLTQHFSEDIEFLLSGNTILQSTDTKSVQEINQNAKVSNKIVLQALQDQLLIEDPDFLLIQSIIGLTNLQTIENVNCSNGYLEMGSYYFQHFLRAKYSSCPKSKNIIKNIRHIIQNNGPQYVKDFFSLVYKTFPQNKNEFIQTCFTLFEKDNIPKKHIIFFLSFIDKKLPHNSFAHQLLHTLHLYTSWVAIRKKQSPIVQKLISHLKTVFSMPQETESINKDSDFLFVFYNIYGNFCPDYYAFAKRYTENNTHAIDKFIESFPSKQNDQTQIDYILNFHDSPIAITLPKNARESWKMYESKISLEFEGHDKHVQKYFDIPKQIFEYMKNKTELGKIIPLWNTVFDQLTNNIESHLFHVANVFFQPIIEDIEKKEPEWTLETWKNYTDIVLYKSYLIVECKIQNPHMSWQEVIQKISTEPLNIQKINPIIRQTQACETTYKLHPDCMDVRTIEHDDYILFSQFSIANVIEYWKDLITNTSDISNHQTLCSFIYNRYNRINDNCSFPITPDFHKFQIEKYEPFFYDIITLELAFIRSKTTNVKDLVSSMRSLFVALFRSAINLTFKNEDEYDQFYAFYEKFLEFIFININCPTTSQEINYLFFRILNKYEYLKTFFQNNFSNALSKIDKKYSHQLFNNTVTDTEMDRLIKTKIQELRCAQQSKHIQDFFISNHTIFLPANIPKSQENLDFLQNILQHTKYPEFLYECIRNKTDYGQDLEEIKCNLFAWDHLIATYFSYFSHPQYFSAFQSWISRQTINTVDDGVQTIEHVTHGFHRILHTSSKACNISKHANICIYLLLYNISENQIRKLIETFTQNTTLSDISPQFFNTLSSISSQQELQKCCTKGLDIIQHENFSKIFSLQKCYTDLVETLLISSLRSPHPFEKFLHISQVYLHGEKTFGSKIATYYKDLHKAKRNALAQSLQLQSQNEKQILQELSLTIDSILSESQCTKKKSTASQRNKQLVQKNNVFHQNHFLHGTDIDGCMNILRYGNFCGEFIETSTYRTDLFPFHVDVSQIGKKEKDCTLYQHLSKLRGFEIYQSNIHIIHTLKKDSYFTAEEKYNQDHQLIPIGIPAHTIVGIYISQKKDEKFVSTISSYLLEIQMYVPIYNEKGELVFSPNEYKQQIKGRKTFPERGKCNFYPVDTFPEIEIQEGFNSSILMKNPQLPQDIFYVKFNKEKNLEHIISGNNVADRANAKEDFHRLSLEKLASDFYVHYFKNFPQHTGVNQNIIHVNGTFALESKIFSGKKQNTQLPDASDGFIISCILDNWDVIGVNQKTQNTHCNIEIIHNTHVWFDTGGALEYRARGEKKTDFTKNASEITKKMYSGVRKEYFKKLNKQLLEQQIQHINSVLSNANIQHIVGQSYLSKKDKQKYTNILIGRRKSVIKTIQANWHLFP